MKGGRRLLVCVFFFVNFSSALKPSQKLGRVSNVPGGLINKSYFRVACTHTQAEKYCVPRIKHYPGSLFVLKPKGIAVHFAFATVPARREKLSQVGLPLILHEK